ncbi:hypothetical protein ACFX14_006791 [Malus domestica]
MVPLPLSASEPYFPFALEQLGHVATVQRSWSSAVVLGSSVMSWEGISNEHHKLQGVDDGEGVTTTVLFFVDATASIVILWLCATLHPQIHILQVIRSVHGADGDFKGR